MRRPIKSFERFSRPCARMRRRDGVGLRAVVARRVEHAILTHSGHEPAVPELQDIDAALAFLAKQPAHDGTAALASVLPDGALLPIPLVTSLWQESPTTSRFAGRAASPARRASDRQGVTPIAGWLALIPAWIDLSSAVAPAAAQGLALGQSALGLAARLASLYLFRMTRSLTHHGTSRPVRPAHLASSRIEPGALGRFPASVLLFNADDFAKVNARYGRDVGDHALREVVSRAQTTLRCTDLLLPSRCSHLRRHPDQQWTRGRGHRGRQAAGRPRRNAVSR